MGMDEYPGGLTGAEHPVMPESVTETKLDDGYVLQRGEAVHLINTTGREILELCDGTNDIRTIIETLMARYPGETVEPPVMQYLAQLRDEGLLEFRW